MNFTKKNRYLYNESFKVAKKKIKKDSKNTSDAHGLEELISGKWPSYQEKSTFITVQSKIEGHSS